MAPAPKFWAVKLTAAQRIVFWNLVVEWGFSGETAYYKALAGEVAYYRS